MQAPYGLSLKWSLENKRAFGIGCAVALFLLIGLASYEPLFELALVEEDEAAGLLVVGMLVITSAIIGQALAKRKRLEQKLQRSDALLHGIVEGTTDAVFVKDLQGRYLLINSAFAQRCGRSVAEVLGKDDAALLPPAEARRLLEIDRTVLASGTPQTGEDCLTVAGELRTFLTTRGVYRDEQGAIAGLIGIARDITELKRMQRAQRRARAIAQRRRLGQTAITAARSRLARDLHDAVTQTLFSASLIADVLPRLWTHRPDEGQRRLDELRQLMRGALAEMRVLLLELHPVALGEAGLSELLRQLTEAVAGRARLPVTLVVDGVCRPPHDVQLALYRIAQEALNNVAQHAGARQALVRLSCRPGQIELLMSDDGRGFDPASVGPESTGLRMMRERAAAIGATLRIDSQPGSGTRITIVWRPAHAGT
jgi:two-component system nitrate/nitrite sensor histidine kinase NarX